MTVQLAPLAVQRFYDNSGALAIGGKLYTYAAGTSIPQATYTDSTGGTANTNPIVLNARGEASIWLTSGQSYKLVLTDSLNNTLWTSDNVTGTDAAAVQLRSDLASTSDATKGDTLIGVKKTNITGANATTQHAVNDARRVDAVLDFGLSTGNSRAANDAAMSAALNSGAKTIFIPNSGGSKYLLSAHISILAASSGITLEGENKLNTILSWQIDTGTADKFGLLLDAYVTVKNLTLENTGSDATNSCPVVSSTPTTSNGMHDCTFKNVRLLGNWGVGTGATIDLLSLTLTRSQAFSNIFDDVEFNGVTTPISLGAGCNNNVWIRPKFIGVKSTRYIKLVEASSNLFISPQFEAVDVSIGAGVLNAELVSSPNNVFLNPYLEPCYGFLADSSPGTIVDSPIIEAFDFTKGTLSSNAILRSTDTSNAGVFAYPMTSHVRTPVSRAASNPTSFVASDDNTNTLTLVDGLTSRDANFKLKPSAQFSKFAVNSQGTWTPQLIGSTGGGGTSNTYTQQNGFWIRVGNLVTAYFRITLSAKDAGISGNVQISGLPFNISNLSLYSPSVNYSEYSNITLGAGMSQLQGEGIANTKLIEISTAGTGIASAFLPVANFANNGLIIGQITYITDAA